MIGISFSLTPAQTKMLLAIVFEHYEGDLCLPIYRSGRNDFVTTAQCLIRRGLVEHNDTMPAYTATDAGRGLATAIVASCRDMLAMTKGVEKRRAVWKPIAELENKHRATRKARARQSAGVSP